MGLMEARKIDVVLFTNASLIATLLASVMPGPIVDRHSVSLTTILELVGQR
jgi:hypothetical protein